MKKIWFGCVMKKRDIIILATATTLLLALAIWMIWGNIAVTVSEYRIECEDLPDSFDGFRIAQVSDLHNDELGEGNARLLKKLKETEPDIIVLTGDLVDRSRTDISVAVNFAKEACLVAPTFYVSGNHESAIASEAYAELCDGLVSVGVTVLENNSVALERDGEYISLVGVSDQNFGGALTDEELMALKSEKADFSIILAHRPQGFDQYAACGYDLLLCGHLHGGQFRLPFLGGLYAPNYGFFPEYDGGTYEKEGSVMVVSRGVGNSSFPIRFNNPREIVLVELVKK